jgi:transposase
MDEPITYIGIDAHKRELQVARLCGDTEPLQVWSSPTDARALERLRRKLERDAPGAIECCYEAGPTGYGLYRHSNHGRIHCRVIAPALVPRKPGDRIKTNRRDARKLATLLRANLLTEVHVPSLAAEAGRDLVRARDARADLMRSRQRLSKLLRRRGLLYAGKAWTKRHTEWLNQIVRDHPAERHVVSDYRLAIAQLDARLAEIDRVIEQVASTRPYHAAVAALRRFRGIDTVTALTLVAELYDFRRFPHPAH